MDHQAKEGGNSPKQQAGEKGNPTSSTGTQSSPSSTSPDATSEGETQVEDSVTSTLTSSPDSRSWRPCRPECLIVASIFMLISLLGSWAVVHLTLGSRGTEPFRIEASYDQPNGQDTSTAATIEPGFTTNCSVGKNRLDPMLCVGVRTC
ncbi:hypothetical protein DPEC_G00295070 [Dallia pectoralis]|uniref:Uncharacterized protein n=1 Tax=Dallia pectoralis TaxID=75939 RepID=A0ACC2FIM6_DALPE|nr:hypothetical protein DPEC_G00295070 [Dallia pectoralis]